MPDWSPDGLTIAFQSEGPTGLDPYGIWTVSRDSVGGRWGEPARLNAVACIQPDWAPDGGSLVCDAGADLVRLSRDGELLARIGTTPAITSPAVPTFSLDGSRIYFRGVQEDGSQGIWWIPPEGGSPTKIVAFDDPAVNVFGGFTVGPERFFLTLAEYESDIWVMDLDW